jgi:hypothetical protein
MRPEGGQRGHGYRNGRSAFTNRSWNACIGVQLGGMHTIRHLMLVLASCLIAPSIAQNTGTLRLIVEPGHDFEFIVDRKHRMKQREIKLVEGLHDLSIWAPTRSIVDTVVFVIADRTSDLVVRLPYSREYADYRHALSEYTNGRRLRAVSPMILVAGLIWTGVSYGSYTRAYDQLETDRERYDTSVDPGLINKLKDIEIPEHKDDFSKARTSLYMGAALTAVGAGVLWYVRSTTKDLQRPSFEDREKVRFDGIAWHQVPGGGVWVAGLSIPLAR